MCVLPFFHIWCLTYGVFLCHCFKISAEKTHFPKKGNLTVSSSLQPVGSNKEAPCLERGGPHSALLCPLLANMKCVRYMTDQREFDPLSSLLVFNI